MRDHTRILIGIILFFPLLLAFSYGHSYLSHELSWLMDLFQTRSLELAVLLAGTVLSGLIAAAVFAYPFAVLYGRAAVWLSLVVSLLAATWRYLLMGDISGKPFVVATWILDFACLIAFLPAGVWAVRRLRPNNSFKPNPHQGGA